jgi:hypothetical protein
MIYHVVPYHSQPQAARIFNKNASQSRHAATCFSFISHFSKRGHVECASQNGQHASRKRMPHVLAQQKNNCMDPGSPVADFAVH